MGGVPFLRFSTRDGQKHEKPSWSVARIMAKLTGTRRCGGNGCGGCDLRVNSLNLMVRKVRKRSGPILGQHRDTKYHVPTYMYVRD